MTNRYSRSAALPTLEEALDWLDTRRPLLLSELRMPEAVPEDNYKKVRHVGLSMHCPTCGETTEDFHFNDTYCRPCRNAYERERYARRKVPATLT